MYDVHGLEDWIFLRCQFIPCWFLDSAQIQLISQQILKIEIDMLGVLTVYDFKTYYIVIVTQESVMWLLRMDRKPRNRFTYYG
jgi:hypothetical protein